MSAQRSPMGRLLRIELTTTICMGLSCAVFGGLALVSAQLGDPTMAVTDVLFAAFFFAVGARMLLVEIPKTKRMVASEREDAARAAQIRHVFLEEWEGLAARTEARAGQEEINGP